VDKVLTRIKAKDVHIDLQQSAKEFLIEKGYDPQYGARPMRRAVERFLEDPLAEELLRGNVKPGDHVEVMAADGKLSFHVAEPEKSATAPAAS
jgi:ATP-dependent Clp protease ATP-binding subunit ClpC